MAGNPYSGMQRGQYSNQDVLDELRANGGIFYPASNQGISVPNPSLQRQYDNMSYPPMSLGPVRSGSESYGLEPEAVFKEVRTEEPRYLGERIADRVDSFGVKPYMTVERVVEVPQVIVKERTKMIPKPEIVERIIEVPKTEYIQHIVEVPQVEVREHIKEVPYTVTEDRVVHIPKVEVQERIIEVPGPIEFRERIEYVTRIEYREIPVDRIVEVEEIEYKVTEKVIEYPEPYFVHEVVEEWFPVPVVQVQEVERIEEVPVIQYRKIPRYHEVPVPTYRQVYDNGEQGKQTEYDESHPMPPPVQPDYMHGNTNNTFPPSAPQQYTYENATQMEYPPQQQQYMYENAQQAGYQVSCQMPPPAWQQYEKQIEYQNSQPMPPPPPPPASQHTYAAYHPPPQMTPHFSTVSAPQPPPMIDQYATYQPQSFTPPTPPAPPAPPPPNAYGPSMTRDGDSYPSARGPYPSARGPLPYPSVPQQYASYETAQAIARPSMPPPPMTYFDHQ